MYIVNRGAKLEQVRRVIREAPLVALRRQLTDREILEACRACGHVFRRRRYDPVVTVFHFLVQAVQREESFAATWQELWTPLAAACPELALARSDLSGLTHARHRLPQAVMERLACQACAESRRVPAERWRTFRLYALDGSTVSMPREAIGRVRQRCDTRWPRLRCCFASIPV